MASSRLRPNTVWVHNDGGHAPRLYAIDQEGRVLGHAEVQNVRNRDWEDLASFVWRGRSYLAIGELGDNRSHHQEVRIHLVPEPRFKADRIADARVRPVSTIRFTYPDGPRDAEGLAADPARERFIVLSKRDSSPQFYTVPWGLSREQGLVVAQPMGSWQTPSLMGRLFSRAPNSAPFMAQMPTALDLTPDGRGWMVLDYTRVWWMPSSQSAQRPLKPIRLPAHGLDQAEAACFSDDGREIWVTTEGRPAVLKIYAPPPAPRPNEASP